MYGERDRKLGDFKWAELVVQKCINENVPLCFVFSFVNRKKIFVFAKVINCFSFNEKNGFVTFSFLVISVIRISST